MHLHNYLFPANGRHHSRGDSQQDASPDALAEEIGQGKPPELISEDLICLYKTAFPIWKLQYNPKSLNLCDGLKEENAAEIRCRNSILKRIIHNQKISITINVKTCLTKEAIMQVPKAKQAILPVHTFQ